MSEKQSTKLFEGVYADVMAEKSAAVSTKIIISVVKKIEVEETMKNTYESVKSTFTFEEAAYLATLYLATKTREKLDNDPMLGALAAMQALAEEREKK